MTHVEIGLLLVAIFAGLGWLTYPLVRQFLIEHDQPKTKKVLREEEE